MASGKARGIVIGTGLATEIGMLHNSCAIEFIADVLKFVFCVICMNGISCITGCFEE